MEQIATIGLDLAKSVFQVHAVDEAGEVVERKTLRRARLHLYFASLPPCLIGMEACATSHYWARELAALGHEVRLIPPRYVKPYVRRSKTDAADAAAICEAVRRPDMRFVPVKSEEQQAVLMLHAVRERLVSQRTAVTNALRAHLAELGIVAPQGGKGVRALIALVEDADGGVPPMARRALGSLIAQWRHCTSEIKDLEAEIRVWHRRTLESRLLATIPGIGLLTATRMVASVTDPDQYASARDFSASLGLVPRQNSSGGKARLGRVSKQGNGALRSQLVVGATSVLRRAKETDDPALAWARNLLARRPGRVVTVALANKMARIAWAVLRDKVPYRAPATA